MKDRHEGLQSPDFNIRHSIKFDKGPRADFVTGENIPLSSKARLRRIGATTLGLWLVLDPVVSQLELNNTSQYITEVKPSVYDYNQGKTINVAAGFGLKDSRPTAESIDTFADYGSVLADIYNNRVINGNNLGDDLIEKAKTEDITEVNFWGGSMAGMLSLEMAVKVQNDEPNIHTKYIILENTPSSLESLRPSQRESGRLLLSFSGIPILPHSKAARFIAEMSLRTKQYAKPGINQTIPFLPFNLTKFMKTGAEVIDDMANRNDKASVDLMDSQYSAIITSNVKDSMMKLGEENQFGKKKPVIVLIRPTSNKRDYVVNSDKAEEEFRQYASEAGLQLVVVNADGIYHGNPSMSKSVYTEIISKIMEAVDRIYNNQLEPSNPHSSLIANDNYRFDDNMLLDEPGLSIVLN